MKLLGSKTSPYVRRIRLLLAEHPYEFVDWDIYNKDRDKLRRRNPALKIPMIEDDDGQIVYDSRVISRYLSARFDHAPLSWDDENRLTLIDAANDSAVILLLSQRSNIDTDADHLFYNLQRERISTSMHALVDEVESGCFEGWHYPSMCLYCMTDWFEFRGINDFAGCSGLLAFRDANRNQPMVEASDPRQAGG